VKLESSLRLGNHDFSRFHDRRHVIALLQLHFLGASPRDHGLDHAAGDADRDVSEHVTELNLLDGSLQMVSGTQCHGLSLASHDESIVTAKAEKRLAEKQRFAASARVRTACWTNWRRVLTIVGGTRTIPCRDMVTRLCAVWLIVLSALPFTAPFAALDLSDFIAGRQARTVVTVAAPVASAAQDPDATGAASGACFLRIHAPALRQLEPTASPVTGHSLTRVASALTPPRFSPAALDVSARSAILRV
jgi:hypothetical protein